MPTVEMNKQWTAEVARRGCKAGGSCCALFGSTRVDAEAKRWAEGVGM